ncbi:MAG: RecQ family ATP-dependent DNA helicase [Akkermansiaceae bacterium]
MSVLQTGEVLRRYFGHDALRPGQREVIERVVNHENTLAILPTGGGKSLCYQLPAMCMEGLSIVISPLIALMRDQVENLAGKGIPCARLDSTTTAEEAEQTHAGILSGELKLLYLSPERLAEPAMLNLLKKTSLALVAVDEAHCISEWGHSFRSSYLRLPGILRSLRPQVILALTATASRETARGIRQAFKILKRNHVQTSFFRENLSFKVTACPTEKKQEHLLDTLKVDGRTPAIVYATRRGDVEELAAMLSAAGIKTRAYHAGMPADARAEVQDGFVAHRFPVICATIAFGMGVDMPDVRSVIHYHPPKSPEGWIQESGRAGRDGKPSHCEVLINGDDHAALESLVMARQPGVRATEAVLQNIFSQQKRAIISRYNLSTLNDISLELLDVLLARLESGGWITPDGGSWMWCHVVPLRWDESARERILQGFPKWASSTLAELMNASQRVCLLDLAEHDVSRMNKILDLLRELEAGGEVRLKLSHSLAHYRIKRQPEDIAVLIKEMAAAFEQHGEHDLGRIEAVFGMAVSRRCIAASLLSYFGETLAQPCGHCSSCAGDKRSRKLPESMVVDVSLEELEQIQEVVAQKRAALASPERLARFLCGIHSPAMMRYRLYNRPEWGMLERLPYQEVLGYTRAQFG